MTKKPKVSVRIIDRASFVFYLMIYFLIYIVEEIIW